MLLLLLNFLLLQVLQLLLQAAMDHQLLVTFITIVFLANTCSCNHLVPGQETILSFSLDPPFTNNRYLDVEGNASKTLEGVELTSNSLDAVLMNSAGRAYYSTAVDFLVDDPSSDVVSFSSIFSFRVTQFQNAMYQAGAGMAFVIASDPSLPPNSSGAFLGLTNGEQNGNPGNRFLAVEFDTFQDKSVQDPEADHIGIDVNNVQSIALVELKDTLSDLLRSNYTLTAWVEYNRSQQLLEVRVSNDSQRPEDPLLRYQVDLAGVLQRKMYVGFSAATGLNYELHKILWWKFSTYEHENSRSGDAAEPNLAYSRRQKHQSGCHKWICRKTAIILLSGTGLLLLAAVGGLGFWLWIVVARGSSLEEFTALSSPVKHYSFRQLSAATRSFSRKELIGAGGFGKVYRGTLPKDGSVVAVKLLSEASMQSEQQFLAELSIIGRLKHRNLVSLKGWCHDKGRLLLVYEFMPNGSLDKHLFSNEPSVLSWSLRYNVLKGVSEALAFLHDGWEQRVIHRDVKAANVLLDANFTARLGDFGLARLMEHSIGPQTMTRAGTTGYIAPELAYTGRATEKSDVYSFGILALEVASGKRALDVSNDRELDEERLLLLDWVWHMHETGRLLDVTDPKLQDDFDEEQMITLLYMALNCCHPDANDRPTMRKCCQMLNGDVAPATPHASRPMTLYYYPDTPAAPLISSNSNTECDLSSSQGRL